MKEYDSMLAVACVVLAVVLNALQISIIADGLVMASQQDYIMAALSAIVISSGLFYSVFTGHRLWLKGLPRLYAWILGCLAGCLVGAMAAWSLSYSAPVGSARWWIGILIGFTIPGQTIALGNMTNGMRDLAGALWWFRPKVKTTMVRPPHDPPAVSISDDTGPEPVQTCVDLPIEVEAESKTRLQEEVRAVTVVSNLPSPVEQAANRIVSSHEALAILISGERVTVRVGRQLSNRKWKLIHSDLRRIPAILWDEAQKAKSAEGSDRIVSGTIRIQPIKGKKNKKKQRAARKLQLDAVERRLQELAERHSSI